MKVMSKIEFNVKSKLKKKVVSKNEFIIESN